MAMQLSSPAFADGDLIPRRYSAPGTNELPPLDITGVPAGARSLAVVIEDRDSPLGERVTHWLAWNLPPDTRHLQAARLPEACRVGTDSFGKVGYTGPNPPEGRHHYRIRLLALDDELALGSGATRPALETAMRDHVLAETELHGIFEQEIEGKTE